MNFGQVRVVGYVKVSSAQSDILVIFLWGKGDEVGWGNPFKQIFFIIIIFTFSNSIIAHGAVQYTCRYDTIYDESKLIHFKK